MKDISLVFGKAIGKKKDYNPRFVSKEIEKILNIWCRLEDDSNLNWYAISQSNGKTVIEDYGYLSARFPVALLKEKCPNDIRSAIKKNNILWEQFSDSFSCTPEILSKYIDTQEIALIDDRFMFDDSIPFNEEVFLKIDEGINYINPYKFSFEDIK